MKKRLAILISGRGSNMEAIVAASRSPEYPAEPVLVIADNETAGGLETAAENGVATLAIPRADYGSQEEHERAIAGAIEASKADIVCLAGFMRILSAGFVQQFEGRLVNIHPSLLPAYKGLDTHARALADGVKIHGCSVHFVNADMDGGPIIAQAAVPVLPGDSEESLAARILEAEHLLYPRIVGLLARDKVRLKDGIVEFEPDASGDPSEKLLSI